MGEQMGIVLIIFMAVVAPLWVLSYYRHKNKQLKGLSQDDQKDLEKMLVTVDRLIDRIDALEDILDEEHPNWRRDVRKTRQS